MRPYISNLGAGARVEYKTRQKAHKQTSDQLESQIQIERSNSFIILKRLAFVGQKFGKNLGIIRVDSSQQSGIRKHLSPSLLCSDRFSLRFTG